MYIYTYKYIWGGQVGPHGLLPRDSMATHGIHECPWHQWTPPMESMGTQRNPWVPAEPMGAHGSHGYSWNPWGYNPT